MCCRRQRGAEREKHSARRGGRSTDDVRDRVAGRRENRDVASNGEVIEEAARRPVRRVHGAEETPRVREQLADGCGTQLRKEGAAMDGAEVCEVSPVVEALGNNGIPCRLLQVQARLGDEVARREEVGELLPDVFHLAQPFVEAAAEPSRVAKVGVVRGALDLLDDGVADSGEECTQLLLQDH